MDILKQELRYAFRSVRRTPLASGVVIATLGIGIALVTTFFSLVNTQFLHPLPYKHADRTISLTPYPVTRRPIDELRSMSKALTAIATARPIYGILLDRGVASNIQAAEVDSLVFRMLDERPLFGNLPSPREISDRARVIVINERLWRRQFGARPDIIGQTVTVDRVPRTVVAVMPAWFTFPQYADAWYPLDITADLSDRVLHAVATLAPGKSIEDVRRELQLLGDRLHMLDSSTYRGGRNAPLYGRTGGLYAQRDMVDRGRGKGPIVTMVLLVVGGAICVLLVACTNVASLMLARGARRRGQMVIRASLGASRWQLVRQQLIESVLLASAAGVIGTVLSLWGIQLVLAMIPPPLLSFFPGWVHFGLDANVLLFAGAVSLVTVLVFGLWPAREGTRFDLTSALRGTADAGIAGRDPTRRLHLPVVLELTFSVALFVAAVMMVRSFNYLANTDRGIAIQDRTRVRVTYDPRDSVAEDYTRFSVDLHQRLGARSPLVDVAFASSAIRFPGDTGYSTEFGVAETGRVITVQDLRGSPMMVSDNYFRVMGRRVLSGRAFDSTEVVSSSPAIVVNRRLATELWGNANPVGKQLVVSKRLGLRGTVIGIVSDRLESSRGESSGLVPARELFFSYRQAITCCARAEFLFHTRMTPPAVSALVTSALDATGRTLPVSIETFAENERREQLLPRMLSMILGSFALAGLILAIMGIYGVVAFSVEQRTREIGVRIALGASGRDITRHLMRGGMQLVGIAIGLGLLAALASNRILTAFVVGTIGTHMVTAVMVALLFGAVGLAACYFPARRAAKLDPLTALRTD
jgi:putative ABC transport system permease protein